MIFFKNHFSNLLIAALLVFVLAKQIPLWLHSNDQIGKFFLEISAVTVQGQKVNLPLEKQKNVYIFWATWCGPCHIQLAQFDKAVASGDLSPDQVVAVSLDQSIDEVKEFVKNNEYSFKIVKASNEQSWSDLNVQATPSIAFVDADNRVQNFFTGLSPFSVFKAKKFLK